MVKHGIWRYRRGRRGLLRQVLKTAAEGVDRVYSVYRFRPRLFAQLVTVVVKNHWHVRVVWRGQAKDLVQPPLPMGGFQQIGASHYVSMMGSRVVNGGCQLVSEQTIAPAHNEIRGCLVGRHWLKTEKAVFETRHLVHKYPDSQAVRRLSVGSSYSTVLTTFSQTGEISAGATALENPAIVLELFEC